MTPVQLLFTKFLSDGRWWTSWFLQSLGSTKGKIHLAWFIPLALIRHHVMGLEVSNFKLDTLSRVQFCSLLLNCSLQSARWSHLVKRCWHDGNVEPVLACVYLSTSLFLYSIAHTGLLRTHTGLYIDPGAGTGR